MVPGAGRYVDGSGTGSTVVRGTDMITRPEVRCRRHGVGPPAGASRYALTMLSPSTLTLVSVSGLVAGPVVGSPVSIENLLPWHGQLITPPSTLLTSQPACVHTLLNALYCPAAGWVIT